MSGVVRLGPVYIRYSWRGVASWGYPVVEIGGLSLWSRSSNGELGIISYHPRGCLTWHWAVSLSRKQGAMWEAKSRSWRRALWWSGNPHAPRPRWWHRFISRDQRRVGQWHDYYRLPFGWTIIVAQQDYHRRRPA